MAGGWEAVRAEMRAGGDWQPVDDNGVVWNRLTIVQASEGDGPEVRADVEIGRDGVPDCREVRISTVGAGRSVRSRDLRAVRLDSLIEVGYGMAVWQRTQPSELARKHGVPIDAPDWVTGSTRAESAAAVRGLRSRRKRKVDDDLLREVASVYRANVHRGPTQAVGERFDKAPSTAALYVNLARKRGFLGEALNGRAGEQS